MAVSLIPREVLFGNPERMGPRLSPDGERLAFLAPKEGVLNVWVGAVGAPLGDFEPVTDDKKRGIRVCFWAEDNTHIVYLQDEGGDESWLVGFTADEGGASYYSYDRKRRRGEHL